MNGFEGVVGHARARRVLERALNSGRIPHAYLFWGIDGIGKELVARGLAKALLCRDPEATATARPCGVCSSCRKFSSGNHPDLHTLRPGEKAISVEEVRALTEALQFQAYEKGRKIAIISDASRMSPAGANALLKTVEEPPRDTHLILLAPHRSRLLPTLVSRCQSIRFDPLSDGEVAEVLVGTGIDAERARGLAELSGGSPGTALALDPDGVEELEAEVRGVVEGLSRMDVAARFDLSERWSKEKDTLELRLRCLERGLALASRGEDAALARLSRLHEVRSLIERNVNVQLALDALFVLQAGERLEEII